MSNSATLFYFLSFFFFCVVLRYSFAYALSGSAEGAYIRRQKTRKLENTLSLVNICIYIYVLYIYIFNIGKFVNSISHQWVTSVKLSRSSNRDDSALSDSYTRVIMLINKAKKKIRGDGGEESSGSKWIRCSNAEGNIINLRV